MIENCSLNCDIQSPIFLIIPRLPVELFPSSLSTSAIITWPPIEHPHPLKLQAQASRTTPIISPRTAKMSYYFTILSPTDTPIFNIAFGTSKGGGDGIARFRFPDTAQYMNQFIIHSSLDILEEAQWTNGGMYVLPSPPLRPSILSSLTHCPKVPQTYRYLPTRCSIHLRIPNPQRRTLPTPASTTSTPDLR